MWRWFQADKASAKSFVFFFNTLLFSVISCAEVTLLSRFRPCVHILAIANHIKSSFEGSILQFNLTFTHYVGNIARSIRFSSGSKYDGIALPFVCCVCCDLFLRCDGSMGGTIFKRG